MRRAFERAYKIYHKNFKHKNLKLSSLKNNKNKIIKISITLNFLSLGLKSKTKNREILFKKSKKRAFEHAYKIFYNIFKQFS